MSDACCGGACETASSPPAVPPRARRAIAVRPTLVVVAAGLLIVLAALLDHPAWSVVLYVGSIALSIPAPARRAWRALRGRALDINVLMVIAVIGAAILGDWIEAAAVVWLFGIAQWLEGFSQARARLAIRRLLTLAPAVALVKYADGGREVPVGQVAVGDLVLVAPGGRIPVDGDVVAGDSAVDQSPITGESWPIEKRAGDAVHAGSINGAGALDVRVTRRAADSTLARIVRLVEQAQRERAPVQRWVDRFARVYTPAVVVLAAAVAVLPPIGFGLAGDGYDFATWVYRALALLVVACPCALVISTPVSIVSALAAAARAGVLIKGGAHLEELGRVRAVAFDKTGTLTAGRITVTDVYAVAGASTHGVLATAAAIEQRSEHPIGRAIVEHARAARTAFSMGDTFRALPGFGAEATVNAVPVIVGSHRLFEERRLCTPSLHAEVERVEGSGRTPVLVGRGGEGIGVLGMSDELRTSVRDTVARLRAAGVVHVAMLTGDRAAAARLAGELAGVDEVHADLLPQDKVAHVARLRARHGSVAMVGDGINDAPALAAASVGVAMGGGGTDVAIETADVALLTDDLATLPLALRIGRATLANIRTNVALALGLKLAFVALAVGGVATLWMAVLADTGASLIVTANGLRLLRFR